jgi:hypothetical protein
MPEEPSIKQRVEDRLSQVQQLPALGNLKVAIRKPVEHCPAEMREQQTLGT